MADDPTQQAPTPPVDDAAKAAADEARTQAAAAKAAEAERIAALDRKLDALADTVRAGLTPRTPVATDGKATIPPQMRQLLRQGGLTDADIDHNAPIIVPFLAATLATEGAALVGQIQNVKDEIDVVKAARNTRKYPDWADVEDKVHELRGMAAKDGRHLSLDDAYNAAVALDLDKISERRAQRKAASAAADLSAQHLTDHGTRAGGAQGTRRTALTAEEIANLPREERKKLFEQLGDVIIR